MTDKKTKNVENLKISKNENSEIEIEGEIVADKFQEAYKKAFGEIKMGLEIPGFRKGKAPDNVVVQRIGEMRILEEAAEKCLEEEYPKILQENKIDAIGQPQITITKISSGSPLGFKIKTAVMPEFEIPDYKAVAKEEMGGKEEKIDVSEKEVEEVVLQIRKNLAQSGSQGKESAGKTEEKNLPELNDEMVKSLGDFKNVADFKEKIKKNLSQEKEAKAKEKKRIAIIESLIEKSKISLPGIIVEGELQKMLAQFKYDVERSGLDYQEYLSHVKKTEEDLRKEWREGAEKKAKSQLILNKIAVAEKISPDEKEVKHQMDHILEQSKEANPERVRIYVETFLTNEMVFKFLEGQK